MNVNYDLLASVHWLRYLMGLLLVNLDQ